ncbi:hypothetical protein J0S82_016499 [Galemys pyrenaicus]|uniref:Uncharacterized protein n=1 Tax=Galemys pyrenaicus TaxID=202257 RepID=A0A8J6DT18_GALPY|nr:hypothetical protein J0S82_016499 [Galemys pyrenaicus]
MECPHHGSSRPQSALAALQDKAKARGLLPPAHHCRSDVLLEGLTLKSEKQGKNLPGSAGCSGTRQGFISMCLRLWAFSLREGVSYSRCELLPSLAAPAEKEEKMTKFQKLVMYKDLAMVFSEEELGLLDSAPRKLSSYAKPGSFSHLLSGAFKTLNQDVEGVRHTTPTPALLCALARQQHLLSSAGGSPHAGPRGPLPSLSTPSLAFLASGSQRKPLARGSPVRRAAPSGPSLRAHKAPGADVRAPLGAAGPQCRRSRAALPPRPASQQPVALPQPARARSPEPAARSPPPAARSPPPAARSARARRTCKLVPPPPVPRDRARSAPPASSHGVGGADLGAGGLAASRVPMRWGGGGPSRRWKIPDLARAAEVGVAG